MEAALEQDRLEILKDLSGKNESGGPSKATVNRRKSSGASTKSTTSRGRVGSRSRRDDWNDTDEWDGEVRKSFEAARARHPSVFDDEDWDSEENRRQQAVVEDDEEVEPAKPAADKPSAAKGHKQTPSVVLNDGDEPVVVPATLKEGDAGFNAESLFHPLEDMNFGTSQLVPTKSNSSQTGSRPLAPARTTSRTRVPPLARSNGPAAYLVANEYHRSNYDDDNLSDEWAAPTERRSSSGTTPGRYGMHQTHLSAAPHSSKDRRPSKEALRGPDLSRMRSPSPNTRLHVDAMDDYSDTDSSDSTDEDDEIDPTIHRNPKKHIDSDEEEDTRGIDSSETSGESETEFTVPTIRRRPSESARKGPTIVPVTRMPGRGRTSRRDPDESDDEDVSDLFGVSAGPSGALDTHGKGVPTNTMHLLAALEAAEDNPLTSVGVARKPKPSKKAPRRTSTSPNTQARRPVSPSAIAYSQYKHRIIHPNTAFDDGDGGGVDVPYTSDHEEAHDAKRAAELTTEISQIHSNLDTRRMLRTMRRGTLQPLEDAPPSSADELKSFIVATDLSPEATHALEWTIGTVLRDGNLLIVVCAFDEDYVGEGKTEEEWRLEAMKKITKTTTHLLNRTRLQVHVVIEVLHCKSPRHVLTDLIDHVTPTLVILGSRGRSAIKGVLLGSFSNYIVEKSSVPVMVARRKLQKTKNRGLNVRLANNLRHGTLTEAKID